MNEQDIGWVSERCATVSVYSRGTWEPVVRQAWAAGWEAEDVIECARRGVPPSWFDYLTTVRNARVQYFAGSPWGSD